MNEFAIEWTKDRNYAGVTAPSGTALKSRLLRYAEEHPDEVTNVTINKDGSVFCHVPVSYVNVRPRKKVSDKQRQRMSELSKQMWAEKKAAENGMKDREEDMEEDAKTI